VIKRQILCNSIFLYLFILILNFFDNINGSVYDSILLKIFIK
jgi:hypothetical protein